MELEDAEADSLDGDRLESAVVEDAAGNIQGIERQSREVDIPKEGPHDKDTGWLFGLDIWEWKSSILKAAPHDPPAREPMRLFPPPNGFGNDSRLDDGITWTAGSHCHILAISGLRQRGTRSLVDRVCAPEPKRYAR